jgi:hypothetical protein
MASAGVAFGSMGGSKVERTGYPDDFIRLTIAEWASPPANKNAKKGTQAANGETGGTSGGGTG